MFPAGPERTRAVAAYGTTAGIGASFGLLVGSAFVEWISWRAAGFFINVPIAVAMIAAALRYLPRFSSESGHFDVAGAIASTLGVGALVFGIIHSGDNGWSAPLTVTLGPPAIPAFVMDSRR
ncbi:MAG TPA: hypothetical protein VIW24_05645 [Aldersonia sp.]